MLSKSLAAIDLTALIDDPLHRVGDQDLGLGDDPLASFVAQEVHGIGGIEDYKTHRIQFQPHLRNALDVGVELANHLSSRLELGIRTSDDSQLNRTLALTDQS